MSTIEIRTRQRVEFVDVTGEVAAAVADGDLHDGCVCVCVQHTTAGLTINENADPSVGRDLAMALERLVPRDLPFAHAEGNSDAHVKASLVGSSVLAPVRDGRLTLGTWQGIFFAEFDGPRRRSLVVQLLPAATART